jgi:hypothetical protein
MEVLEQEQAAEELLRAQIVDDPEHVRRVIADMRDSAAREVSRLSRCATAHASRRRSARPPPLPRLNATRSRSASIS